MKRITTLGIVTSLICVLTLWLVWGQGSWVTIGSTSFKGGLGEALISRGDTAYIFRQHSTGAGDGAKYQVSPGAMVQLVSLPLPPERLKNGTALALDAAGNLYVLLGGAYADSGTTGRRYFYLYDGIRWKPRKDTPEEQGAGDAMSYVKIGEREYLYAFLGANRSQRPAAQNVFVRYDIANDSWELLASLPWPCVDDGAALAWDGGHYVYGLRGNSLGNSCQDDASQEFGRYDLTNEQWEEMNAIPEGVNDGGSLVWDGDDWLYATTGGATEGGDGKGFYRYSLRSQAWDTSLPRLECPVGGWNGNRLGIYSGIPFYWQGSSSTWQCGGNVIQRFSI